MQIRENIFIKKNQESLANIGSGNALVPDDIKPLPQPLLTYKQTPFKLLSEFIHFKKAHSKMFHAKWWPIDTIW